MSGVTGNSVAATIFPKEIMSLSIIEATVFPKEIMSLPGNSVAHARCTCSIDTSWLSLQRMEQREYDMLLAFCCDCKNPPECSKNEKDCIRRRAKNFIVKELRFAILSRQRQQGIPGKLHV